MRVANLPSVVSNVWLGIALTSYYWGPYWGSSGGLFGSGPFGIGVQALALLAAAACLYLCGCFLNDWHDREWDARHRPERAIPRGLFPGFAYLWIAVALGLAGLGCGLVAVKETLPVLATILLLVVAYTFTHKKHPAAVLLVPLCRALLVWAGWSLAQHDLLAGFRGVDAAGLPAWEELWHSLASLAFPLTHSVGVFSYVLGLSLVARHEASGRPSQGTAVVAKALLLLPLAAMSAWWIPHYPLAGVAGLVPFAVWLALALTVYRRPVPRLVSALLAGLPLVDFIAALPLVTALVLPGQSPFEQRELVITLMLPPVAFAVGRLLQRLAPAT